jgi:anti-sigma factor RsiW
MRCPDARDALLEITTGRTPPDVRRAVAAHLATCAECRAVAGELEEAVALLRAVPDPAPPEGFWAEFMVRLEERVGGPVALRTRLRRWLRTPPSLVPAAATAAVALLFAVSSVVLRPPVPGAPSLESQVAPYVTDSMRSLLPHLEETVQIWSSGLGAEDAEPLFESAPLR